MQNTIEKTNDKPKNPTTPLNNPSKQPIEFPASPDENPLPHEVEVQAGESETANNAADFGREANLQDAKISGYTDKKGQAVSMAKKDVEGNPTGAYTDIGAGRSSVVKPEGDLQTNSHSTKTIEDAPTLGEEQAP